MALRMFLRADLMLSEAGQDSSICIFARGCWAREIDDAELLQRHLLSEYEPNMPLHYLCKPSPCSYGLTILWMSLA